MMSEAEKPIPEETEGLSAEEFSALAQRFSAVAPILRSFFPEKSGEEPSGVAVPAMAGAGKPPPHSRKSSPRETLLLALKPYLSEERQQMADYLIRMGRLYDTLRGLF